MIIECTGIKFNVEYAPEEISAGKIPVIFFHGFTGSSSEWDFLQPHLNEKFTGVFIDLPGHGKTKASAPEYYSPVGMSASLNELFNKLTHGIIILAGYSMGGRAALSYFFNYPNNVKGLFLESTSPGLKNYYDRIERRKSDTQLAEKIKINGIESFVNYWMNIPLFDSQKKLSEEELDEIKNAKLKNDSEGLIKSLTMFGTGSMPSNWERLKDLNIPAALISGSSDSKFSLIMREMNELIPVSDYTEVPGCGHNIHLEKPADFINLLNRFLQNFV